MKRVNFSCCLSPFYFAPWRAERLNIGKSRFACFRLKQANVVLEQINIFPSLRRTYYVIIVFGWISFPSGEDFHVFSIHSRSVICLTAERARHAIVFLFTLLFNRQIKANAGAAPAPAEGKHPKRWKFVYCLLVCMMSMGFHVSLLIMSLNHTELCDPRRCLYLWISTGVGK
jgi:hypothetical protein